MSETNIGATCLDCGWLLWLNKACRRCNDERPAPRLINGIQTILSANEVIIRSKDADDQ